MLRRPRADSQTAMLRRPRGSLQAAPSVRIMVKTLAGDILELLETPDTLVQNLKQKIAQRWGIPAVCQTLISGLSVMEDSKKIVFYLEGQVLDVNLVKCLDNVHEMLRCGSTNPMIEAIEILGDLAFKGDEDTIEKLCECAEQGHSFKVRIATVRALPKVAHIGDERALATLIACSMEEGGHIIQDLRMAAVKALPLVASQGDQLALEALHARVQDTDRLVRCCALQAIGAVVSKLDEIDNEATLSTTASAISTALFDESFMVREAAASLLD